MNRNYLLTIQDGGAAVTDVTGVLDVPRTGVLIPFPSMSDPDSDILVITKEFITHYGRKYAADLRGKDERPEPRIEYRIQRRNFGTVWCRVFHWPKWYIIGDPQNEKSTAFLRCAKCQVNRVEITREVI